MPKADFIADGVLTPDLKYQLDSSYYPDLPIVSQNHSAEDVIDYNANPYVMLIQYNSGRTGVFSIGPIRKYNQQEVDDLKALVSRVPNLPRMTLNDVKEGTAMVSVALIVDRTSTLYQDSVFIDIPLEHLIKGYSPILDATIGAISIRKYPIRLAELLREES